MIQRIQTIFLFLAALFALLLFKLPFGSVSPALANSQLFADGIFSIQDNVGLLVLFSVAGLLALIAIFLFKNRDTQKLLGRISIIANVLGIVLGIVLFMQDHTSMATATPKEELGLGLPLLSIICGLFALRFISKDDKLVRSMDRLR